jgi:ABC-2 type transport system permease protein
MIRINKILALLYYDIITYTKSKERLIEFLFFPITSTIIWGLFAKSIIGISKETAMMFLLINIFWGFSYLFQSSANIQVNTDVWSRSLNQLLASGISEMEFIIGRLIFATITSLLVICIMLSMAVSFGFSMPPLNQMMLLILATILASMIWCVVVLSLYITLGKDYAFLSWSFMQLVILFSAPFFPIDTYPFVLRGVARLLPHTWIFEALKELSRTGLLNMAIVYHAVILSAVYLVLLFPFYMYMWKKAKRSGALVKLGS